VAGRLFLEIDLARDATLTLERERSHYLCRVLRLRTGDAVELFNGDGRAWRGTIEQADPRRCRVLVGEEAAVAPAPRCRLHLATALLKGERQDWVLQKATELGSTDIWLLDTERSEARVRDERRTNRVNHWQRVMQAACEQSGRLLLPELHGPRPLHAFWSELPDATSTYCFQPGASPFDPASTVADVALVTGPEGGFSDAELAAAQQSGATPAGLGALVLRADTAPVAALTLIRQAWSWAAP
jgi:16S rRNA (uracil1498-N3)-methyltransferase